MEGFCLSSHRVALAQGNSLRGGGNECCITPPLSHQHCGISRPSYGGGGAERYYLRGKGCPFLTWAVEDMGYPIRLLMLS